MYPSWITETPSWNHFLHCFFPTSSPDPLSPPLTSFQFQLCLIEALWSNQKPSRSNLFSFFYFPSGWSSNSCFVKACLLLTLKMNHMQSFCLVLSVRICPLCSEDLFFFFCFFFFPGLTFNNLRSDVLKLVSLQSPQSAFPTKPLPMSSYNEYAGREQKHFEV